MKCFLANGKIFEGKSFGHDSEVMGEVVFTTGMTGYLEVLTDPSYYGQIVVFTFPLIGNYGVPKIEEFFGNIDKTFESKKIWAKGVILAEVSEKFSHITAFQKFSDWLKNQKIPAISDVDTRQLTQILREKGTILGYLGLSAPKKFDDKLNGRFVPEVSPKKVEILSPKKIKKTIAFIDCGAKNGIFRHFLDRNIEIIRCSFDTDPFALDKKFDGIFFSNGPGDPSQYTETIDIAKKALAKNIPIFGICLGNQILALAAGGKTKKMKYGHRGVNQPVQDLVNKKCLITSQNHGFEVDEKFLPKDFEVWFKNLNDGSVEGIRHKKKPIFSVQFHPEACAGPEDSEYLFDLFIKKL